ncbi:hypothetical protein [Streptomyces johnsoniae]|uniref:Lipoprotein n=1 Tax=Streptomyces johnsoniae TaxID=3075532 RepID=A0ABU2S216_9ACTN|nr:hypothetical protein [Streptomyces sp. DSM 41886]MDT0443051.1 hypothetical protein [Streptomyces sp. DSM 41886]
MVIGGAVLVSVAGCGSQRLDLPADAAEGTATPRAAVERPEPEPESESGGEPESDADAVEPEALPESEDEAMEWLERSAQAVADVSEVHSSAVMETGGRQVTMETVVSGDRCTQSMEFPDIGATEHIHIGDEVWIRPAELYWWGAEGGQDTVDAYAGAYVRGPRDHPDFAGSGSGCDAGLAQLAGDDPDTEYSYRMGEETRHDGQRAVTIHVTESHPLGIATGTFLIAAEGEPYLLRLTNDMEFEAVGGQRMSVSVDWTDYGRPTAIDAPPAEQTVHIDDLAAHDNPFPLG